MLRLLLPLFGALFLGISMIHAGTNLIHAAHAINAHLTGTPIQVTNKYQSDRDNFTKTELQAYVE